MYSCWTQVTKTYVTGYIRLNKHRMCKTQQLNNNSIFSYIYSPNILSKNTQSDDQENRLSL